MLQRLAPELATCAPGALKAARMPALEMVIRLGAEHTPGMLNYDDVLASGRTRVDPAALDALGAGLSCHDAISIQLFSAPKRQGIEEAHLVLAQWLGLLDDDSEPETEDESE